MFCFVSSGGLGVGAAGRGLGSPALSPEQCLCSLQERGRAGSDRAAAAPGGARRYQRTPSPSVVSPPQPPNTHMCLGGTAQPRGALTPGLHTGAAGTARIQGHIRRELFPEVLLHRSCIPSRVPTTPAPSRSSGPNRTPQTAPFHQDFSLSAAHPWRHCVPTPPNPSANGSSSGKHPERDGVWCRGWWSLSQGSWRGKMDNMEK